MASEDRGCCDKCAKGFIMMINVVIIIIGGAILGAGVYWQLSPTGFYKEIFNHDIFNVPIVSIVVGSLLLLIGLCGFFGACCEVLFLLKVYMGFLIIIMLVEIVVAVGCVAMKTTVESYATNQTYTLIEYYGDDTKDEASIIKETIDAVQENFECCGVTGPEDWPNTNSRYAQAGDVPDHVPDSCCKDSSSECGAKVDYRTNTDIYTTGCKTAIIQFVDDNLLYVGIAAGVIVILQVTILIMASKFRTTIEDESYEYF